MKQTCNAHKHLENLVLKAVIFNKYPFIINYLNFIGTNLKILFQVHQRRSGNYLHIDVGNIS